MTLESGIRKRSGIATSKSALSSVLDHAGDVGHCVPRCLTTLGLLSIAQALLFKLTQHWGPQSLVWPLTLGGLYLDEEEEATLVPEKEDG